MLSTKIKTILIALFIIVNIILRFQIVPHEIGVDSFDMHIMANSISEFGYANWILHPLSFFGLYPASYASSMQFLLSGISQTTGIDMEWTIFVYTILIGIISIFTAYLMAGEIIDNELFKLSVAIGYSTAPAILDNTTWTIPARGLFMVLAPVLIYLLLKCRISVKYVLLTSVMSMLLFSTHHLFYFLIPAFLSFFILLSFSKTNTFFQAIQIPKRFMLFLIIIGFFLMFSIPFFTGRFLESSRYSPVYLGYVRYVGILMIPAISGLIYLMLEPKKSFGKWFLLLTVMFLIMFVFKQTYMKSFIPLFAIPLAGIGLLNVIKISEKTKYARFIVVIFLVLSFSFSGYFQFLHSFDENPFNKRNIEEETYKAGQWIKVNLNGSAISNDKTFDMRIFSISGTIHLITVSTVENQIYGFTNINISDYKRYQFTDENFWYSGYEGPDFGEKVWYELNLLKISPNSLNITYFIENTKGEGNLIWNHKPEPSKLLNKAYGDGYLVYDGGKPRVWKLE